MKRKRDDGLRKLCSCPLRRWGRCDHPWYFSYKPRGRTRVRVSLDRYTGRHVDELDDAKGLAAQLRSAVDAGTYPPSPPLTGPAVERVTFSVAADRFWKTVTIKRGKNQGKPRGAGEGQMIGVLCAWTPPGASAPLGQHGPADVTEDVYEAFTGHLRGQGRTSGTISKYVQLIIALDRWFTRKGYRPTSVISGEAAGLRRSKPAKRDRRLVPDLIDEHGKVIEEGEEKRLLKAANPWLQRVIIAALQTGCRRGELLGLTWGDVDLGRGELTIRAASNKTGAARTIPISPTLRAVLDLLKIDPAGKDRPRDAHVFGDAIGQPIASIKKAWGTTVLKAHGHEPEWTEKGGLSAASRAALRAVDLHLHDLRHEAGSRLIEAGWPLHHIQTLLGHSSLAQTSTYLNVAQRGLHDSMARFGTMRAWQSVAKPTKTEHPHDSHDRDTVSPQPTIN